MRTRSISAGLLVTAAAITLTASGVVGGGASVAIADSTSVSFTVDVATGRHPISPLIYGVNNDPADLAAGHGTIMRLGGDRWTAFNWANNDSNAGNSNPGAPYSYQNDDYLSPSTTPGAAVQGPVEQATKLGAAVEVTVPINDWVAADRNGNGSVCRPSPCDPTQAGYDTTTPWLTGPSPRFAHNYPTDPARTGPLTDTPDTTPLAPVYEDQFVHWLRDTEPGANVTLMLGNEPDYWNSTHPEIHPQPVTYAELWQRTSAYATALRAAWPGVPIAGPDLGGWPVSLNEGLGSADYTTHGDFVSWYLDQVHGSRDAAGRQLVSNLDFHWYPQSPNVYSDDTSPAVAAVREQVPRSLWDPSFTENSRITASQDSGPLEFIPRVERQIAAHNPGMKLDLSEWSFGAEHDISGGIADADALGIFGKYGLDAAMYWGPVAGTFVGGAFDIYRNYDGRGSAFGDTELQAATSDPVNFSVYASTSSSDPKRVVVVAINKRTVATTATIDLAHYGNVGDASVYELTAGSPAPQPAGTVTPTGPTQYTVVLPAQSVVVIAPTQRGSAPSPNPGPSPNPTPTPPHAKVTVKRLRLVCTHRTCDVTFTTNVTLVRAGVRVTRNRVVYATGSVRPRHRSVSVSLSLRHALTPDRYKVSLTLAARGRRVTRIVLQTGLRTKR